MSNLCSAPLITTENAVQLAKNSWIKRNARMAELKAAERELKQLKEKLAEVPPLSNRAERMDKQMTLIERAMKKTNDADELQKLSSAHARLFSAWCVLTGTQSPGVKKSSRTRQPQSSAEPLPDPTPITTKSEEPNG